MKSVMLSTRLLFAASIRLLVIFQASILTLERPKRPRRLERAVRRHVPSLRRRVRPSPRAHSSALLAPHSLSRACHHSNEPKDSAASPPDDSPAGVLARPARALEAQCPTWRSFVESARPSTPSRARSPPERSRSRARYPSHRPRPLDRRGSRRARAHRRRFAIALVGCVAGRVPCGRDSAIPALHAAIDAFERARSVARGRWKLVRSSRARGRRTGVARARARRCARHARVSGGQRGDNVRAINALDRLI